MAGIYISYLLISGVLVSYLLFPSLYVTVSSALFSAIYRYPSHPEIQPAAADEPGTVPLYVIARPPQTPYDSVLVTERTGRPYTGSPYVYTEKGMPVGYIDKQRGSLYTVVLFSSALSKEIFSVDGHVAEGKGVGGGGFHLITPIDRSIRYGKSIIHQTTGAVAGSVITVDEISERNIQRIGSVIAENPAGMSVLYLRHDGGISVDESKKEQAIREQEEEIRRKYEDKETE